MNIEKLTKYCQIQPPIQTYLAGQTIRTRRAKVSKAWLGFLIYILTNVFQQCSAASEEKGNRRVEEGAGDEGR